LDFVLIGVPVKNCAKYLAVTVDQITALSYPKNLITLVFLEGDSSDDSWKFLNTKIKLKLNRYKYRSVKIVKQDFGFRLPHTSRHLAKVQPERGRILGEVRGFIIDNYLADNEYVCWFDADLEKIPSDYIEYMIYLNKTLHAHIIAPVVITKDGKVYVLGTNTAINGKLLHTVEIRNLCPYRDLVIVDQCEPWFISRKVFDAGVTSHDIKNGLELIVFANRAHEQGFTRYLTPRVVVTHQSIFGLENWSESKPTIKTQVKPLVKTQAYRIGGPKL
jgi:glycosyltransferase involved in cell wall biosynthesis